MEYTRLGNTGLTVSRLAMGAMTFTSGDDTLEGIYKTNEDTAGAMVEAALDAGVNFFDTADAYASGQSEELLGRALGDHRPDVVIATKVGFRSGRALGEVGLSRDHIMRSIDRSLERLGVDTIDLYIAHTEDPYTPLDETLRALDDVVRTGKANYIGLSNWRPWRVAEAVARQRAEGLAEFSSVQMHYSAVGRDIEVSTIPMLERFGLGLTTWSPLAGGFLTGKYTPENLDDPNFRLSSFDLLPFDKERGFEVVEAMRSISEQRGCSIPQVAIGWLLAKEAVSSVLVGASTLSQLEDNLGAAETGLTSEEIAAIDELMPPAKPYPYWFVENLADEQMQEALSNRHR